jgi:SulP family sulfate permease
MRAFLPAGIPFSKSFPADLVAGITAAAVVIPQAMAYASVAGLPVEVGIYTCVVPMAVYAVLGSSRTLSVSTTSTIAILVATALGVAAPQGTPEQLLVATATLSALVGAMLVVAGLLRLGFLAKFISEPVLVGFKAGIALVIVVDRLPKLLGVKIDKAGWLHNVLQVIRHVPETSATTIAIGAGAIVVIFGLKKFVPRAPAPLIAMAGAIALAAWLGLDAKDSGVATLGAIPGGLPSFVMPDLSLVERLWPAAMGIALMSFTETIAVGRACTGRGEPRPVANRELTATGAANALGGLFGAMPAGGGMSQTSVNGRAGAMTQMAELVTAVVGVATLLFLAPVLAKMPHTALAAVVIATTIHHVSPAPFVRIRKFRTLEFTWAIAAAAGVVFLGTLDGILVAVVLSMIGLMYLGNNPPVYEMVRKRGTDVFRAKSAEHPDDESFPGLLIVRTDARVHFGNIEHIGDRMWPLIRAANPKVVLIDCSSIAGFEYTALERLDAAEEQLQSEGVEMWLAALTPEAFALVQRTPLGARLGRERLHFTVERAVDSYLARGAKPPAA